jgi:hypothetical protein
MPAGFLATGAPAACRFEYNSHIADEKAEHTKAFLAQSFPWRQAHRGRWHGELSRLYQMLGVFER